MNIKQKLSLIFGLQLFFAVILLILSSYQYLKIPQVEAKNPQIIQNPIISTVVKGIDKSAELVGDKISEVREKPGPQLEILTNLTDDQPEPATGPAGSSATQSSQDFDSANFKKDNKTDENYFIIEGSPKTDLSNNKDIIFNYETSFEGSNYTDYSIPDNGGNSSYATSTINISDRPAGSVISKLRYEVQVNHAWVNDLKVKIVKDGNVQYIWNQNGGQKDNGQDDDTENDQDIYLYRWLNSEFDGVSVNGSWNLIAGDFVRNDVGIINYWRIWVYYEVIENPTLSSSSYISPQTNTPSQIFTAWYRINNPNSQAINVGLGASIKKNGQETEYYDSTNDDIVSAPSGWSWQSRDFDLSRTADANGNRPTIGDYQWVLAIWSGAPGISTWYASTGWQSGLKINNRPTLYSNEILPSTSRYLGTNVTFSVYYKDLDNNAPSGDVKVKIGSNEYAMSRSDWWPWPDYSDGEKYQYSTSSLSRGSYNIKYNASDGNFSANELDGGTVTVENRSPYNPHSGNSSLNGNSVTLTWQGVSDPDGDSVIYKVYLDNNSNPQTLIGTCNGITSTSCTKSDLNYNTTYYWRVEAVDSYASTATTSDTWNLTTPSPPRGDLQVTIKNVTDGLRGIPGNSGEVQLYRSDGTAMGTPRATTTAANGDGVVTFADLSQGHYYIQAKYNSASPWGKEDWGTSVLKYVQGNEADSYYNELEFTRNNPTVTDIRFYRGDTNQEVDVNSTLYSNERIRAELWARTNNSGSEYLKASLFLDRNKDTNYDFSETQQGTVTATATKFTFYFTPLETGLYHRTVKVGSLADNLYDGWAWQEAINIQSRPAQVSYVRTLNASGQEKSVFNPGDPLIFRVYTDRGEDPLTVYWRSFDSQVNPILSLTHWETINNQPARTSFDWLTFLTNISPGIYNFRGEVNNTSSSVEYRVNQGPNSFSNISPANEAENQSTSPTVSWQRATDSDGDDISYEVWLGTEENILGKIADVSQTNEGVNPSYIFSNLANDTPYWWQIKAKDSYGLSVWGAKWRFRTSSRPNLFSPTLSNKYVTPARGSHRTHYTYYITYKDLDNDAPTTAYLMIDQSNIHNPLQKVDLNDNDYTNGVVYKYQTSNLSPGSHNYYFHFSDGDNIAETAVKHNQPIVTNNKPNIAVFNQTFPTRTNQNLISRVVSEDPDNDSITTKWYVNNVLKGQSNLSENQVIVDFPLAGFYEVKFEVVDQWGANNSYTTNWYIVDPLQQNYFSLNLNERIISYNGSSYYTNSTFTNTINNDFTKSYIVMAGKRTMTNDELYQYQFQIQAASQSDIDLWSSQNSVEDILLGFVDRCGENSGSLCFTFSTGTAAIPIVEELQEGASIVVNLIFFVGESGGYLVTGDENYIKSAEFSLQNAGWAASGIILPTVIDPQLLNSGKKLAVKVTANNADDVNKLRRIEQAGDSGQIVKGTKDDIARAILKNPKAAAAFERIKTLGNVGKRFEANTKNLEFLENVANNYGDEGIEAVEDTLRRFDKLEIKVNYDSGNELLNFERINLDFDPQDPKKMDLIQDIMDNSRSRDKIGQKNEAQLRLFTTSSGTRKFGDFDEDVFYRHPETGKLEIKPKNVDLPSGTVILGDFDVVVKTPSNKIYIIDTKASRSIDNINAAKRQLEKKKEHLDGIAEAMGANPDDIKLIIWTGDYIDDIVKFIGEIFRDVILKDIEDEADLSEWAQANGINYIDVESGTSYPQTPVVTTNGGNNFYTNNPNIIIEGWATNDAVKVYGSQNQNSLSEINQLNPIDNKKYWQYPIELIDDGSYSYYFVAENNQQRRSPVRIFTIVLDRANPDVNSSIRGGIFSQSQLVSLNSQDQTAVIYYTIDGSEPSTNSLHYINSIEINTTTLLKFFAIDAAGNRSSIKSARYSINTYPIILNSSWKTISVNSELTNLSIFGGADIRRFNHTTDQYERVTDRLRPGEGYWVRANADLELDLPIGDFDNSQKISFNSGFGLVSGYFLKYADNLRLNDGIELKSLSQAIAAGWFKSNAYYFEDGTYKSMSLSDFSESEVLGRSFWLRLFRPVTLSFDGSWQNPPQNMSADIPKMD